MTHLSVQLLEGLLCPGASVLHTVLVCHTSLEAEHALIHIDRHVSPPHKSHHKVVTEPRVRRLD